MLTWSGRGVQALVIGVSSIVTRRVIQALAGLEMVEVIHLASRRPVSAELVPLEKRGSSIQGYDKALACLGGGIAYISLPNSLHALWARRALEAGFHVVIDKPAATSLSDVEELVSIAQRQRLCLAEATVWACHPQFQKVEEVIATAGERITRILATFSFPPLPNGNFRSDPRLGGGCLLDLGPYAASCGRHFFGEPETEVIGRVLTRNPDNGLETSFSLVATYPGGRAITGHFGFNTEYRNTITLLGSNISMDLDRAFTAPPDFAPQVHCRKHNRTETLACPAGDTFALFLGQVIQAIQKRDWGCFADSMLRDARFIHQLRISAGVIK